MSSGSLPGLVSRIRIVAIVCCIGRRTFLPLLWANWRDVNSARRTGTIAVPLAR
jgi:hypothetical protein